MSLQVLEPGLVEYADGVDLQLRLWRRVLGDPSEAHLILLEHAAVFTLGKRGNEANVLAPHGIPVVRTDRGGDVTYHGPGQLVGYLILSLRARRLGVKGFVRRVEKALVAGLADLGLRCRRRPGRVGVWCGGRKIASLGFRVDRGVTRHGFALNVRNSLEPFGWIHPCGEPEVRATSVSEELGRAVSIEEASRAILPPLSQLGQTLL